MRKVMLINMLSFSLSLIGCNDEEMPEYQAKNDAECEFHGTLVSGTCQCLEAYVGSTCGQCADTYQDNDNNHSCLPDCSHLDSCFLNSECQDAQGAAQCICEDEYYQLAGGGCMTSFWVSHDISGISFGTSIDSTLSGMSYVAGGFRGSFQFAQEGTVLESVESRSNTFLIALHPDGSEAWSNVILSNGYNLATSIAATQDGDILVAGHFEQDVDFGKDADGNQVTFTATGLYDLFFARYSHDGVLLWAKRAGDTGNIQDTGIAISASDFYLSGTFGGNVKFGEADNLVSLSSPDKKYDAFVARFDEFGDLIWVQQVSSVFPEDFSLSIVSTNGGPVIAGEFAHSVTFDPTSSFALLADDQTDAFVAKYTPDGKFLWATKLGGEGAIHSLVGFDNGDLLVTGGISNKIFVKKLLSDGSDEWTKEIGPTDHFAMGTAVTTALNGKFAIAGILKGTVTFGAGKSSVELVGEGESSIFIAKYNQDATLEWATVSSNADESTILDISMLRDGTIFATGAISSSTTFWSGEEQEIIVEKARDSQPQAFVMGVYGPYSGPVEVEEQERP